MSIPRWINDLIEDHTPMEASEVWFWLFLVLLNFTIIVWLKAFEAQDRLENGWLELQCAIEQSKP